MKLSDEAQQHLAMLVMHRPNEELVIRLKPKACAKCREIAEWAESVAPSG